MAEFVINKSLTKKSDSVTLNTAGKYVDRNIVVNATAKDGALAEKADSALTLTPGDGVANVTSTDIALVDEADKEAGATYFEIKGTGSGSVSAKYEGAVNVTTEGWVSSADDVTINKTGSKASNEASVKKYVKEAGVTVSEKSNSVDVTVTPTAVATSESATGHSVKVSAGGTVTVTGAVTAGYTSGKTEDASVTVSKDKTVYIQEGSLGNAAKEGTYAVTSGPVLKSGDYLYIEEGYYDKQKIALADLVPDGSNVKGKENLVYKTVSVYDNDGVLVAGTMDDATVTANGATVSSVAFTLNAADNTKYDITGSADIPAPTVTSVGLITDTIGTKSGKTGGAKVAATVNATTFDATVTTAATSAGTIDGGKYIKITAGYNPSDVYYKAASQSEGPAAVVAGSASASGENYDIKATTPGYATGTLVSIPIYQGDWT